MERAQRQYEFDRPARGMGKMCRTLREENPVLSFPSFGETGDHRMGASELSLRRERRGRDQQASVRSLLYPALLVEARCDDCFENCAHDVVWKGTVAAQR